MIPEPLKGKERRVYSDINLPIVFQKEDIKSAVEWLNKKLKEMSVDVIAGGKDEKWVECDVEMLCVLVNETFEDVTKNDN